MGAKKLYLKQCPPLKSKSKPRTFPPPQQAPPLPRMAGCWGADPQPTGHPLPGRLLQIEGTGSGIQIREMGCFVNYLFCKLLFGWKQNETKEERSKTASITGS